MHTILLISPYWKEEHRWMVSSVKLSELWQRLGYRVVVLCMGRTETITNNQKPLALAPLTIHRVRDLFLPDPWNYGIAPGFSRRALHLARELKPDVIIVNKILFWSSLALLRLRMAGFRVLLVTDALVGITWWPRPRLARICSAIYAWTLGWLILRAATRITFFHPQPEWAIRRLGIEHKSTVIPTGIDLTPFIHQKLKTKNQKTVTVTYVGRLESVKGVDDFLAAVLKVKKEYAEIRAQVVGWYRPRHLLVEEHASHVSFLGLRQDIPAILAGTDIFVLPSHSEGLSNALMEAMASACACIATEVGGNAFLIQNGVSGFLYPPGDRAALASHIRRLTEDPAKRFALGEAARRRIEEHCSWDITGKRYRELFNDWMRSEDAGGVAIIPLVKNNEAR